MLDELLLHVGPEKTGTTTIQMALASAAGGLTAGGTFVPLASGELPGHHLPILREVVGDAAFETHYEYSQDVLSLQETLAELSRNGCTRMVLSAESFSDPSARGDVLRLIQMIQPDKLTVIHALRSVVPWLLSWHAQEIKYGLFERGSWPVDRFLPWFVENAFTVNAACALWRDGPWDFSLRTLVLPSGTDHDLARMFTTCADLPVPLLQDRPVNRRMDACELRFLQALNIDSYDSTAPLQKRALVREMVLSSVERHGVPSHTCDCAVQLDPVLQAGIESDFAEYVAVIVPESDVIEGDMDALTGHVPADQCVHSRFPGPVDGLTWLPLLQDALDESIAVQQEARVASDFWHAQADAYLEARDHEREQAQNWQKAADEIAEARDHWRDQAQNWQNAASDLEAARDFWHEQAQNWERAAGEQSTRKRSD